jgi:DNA replication and repair protein RecF
MVRIDGSVSGPAGLARVATILWLTPRMDRLFVEGASARRRFLDRMVLGLHPAHGRETAAYERAMRERLNLLTHHGRNGGDAAWLTALECQMAEHGVAIAAARIDTIGHLTEQISQLPAGAFPKALLALEGLLEAGLQDAAALQVEEDFARRLAANREGDGRRGRTAEGPHRSDLLATHMGKGMPANLCSTGEQKALLVGLLLANAMMLKAREDRAPILLLDEIAAHMDEAHRSALFGSLLELGCQTWLTGTDMALFASLGGDAIRFSVQEGQLDRAA